MSDIEIHHLGAAYALDALDERERATYEAHYVTCAICRTDVVEMRAAAGELGNLTVASPPPGLKSKVMAEVAVTRQLSPLSQPVRPPSRRWSAWSAPVLAVAAALLVVLAGAVVLSSFDESSFADEIAAMIDDPSVAILELEGEGQGSFKVMWTDERAAVVGGGLPDPGEGRRYELWMIDDAGAHAMGMLDPATDGVVHRVLAMHGTPLAWGVTIEPDSGSSTPTEPILFAGSA